MTSGSTKDRQGSWKVAALLNSWQRSSRRFLRSTAHGASTRLSSCSTAQTLLAKARPGYDAMRCDAIDE